MKVGDRVKNHRMSGTGTIKKIERVERTEAIVLNHATGERIERIRINVLNHETGERTWYDLNDYQATWKPAARSAA